MDFIKRWYWIVILVVYLCAAFFSVGHLQNDEYAQILQFAAYKLHPPSRNHLLWVPWEFHAEIRPAIQTFFVVYLYKFIGLFTKQLTNPFFVALLTRLFSMTLSVYAAYLFILQFSDELKNEALKKWMILLNFFSYLVVFNSVRYSSENVSGKIFIIALCSLFALKNNQNTWRYFQYFLCGLLLGISFCVRYQVGLMILGLMMWLLLIEDLSIQLWGMLACGTVMSIIAGITVDHWLYGHWVLTEWNYLDVNLIQHRAAGFGVSPWYSYAGIMKYLPYGILYALCTTYFILHYRKHVITWIVVPFLLVHMFIGHKELRFLTPLLPLMPLVVMLSVQSWKSNEQGFFYKITFSRPILILNRFAWYLNCIVLLIVMFTPANSDENMYQMIFNKYKAPMILFTNGWRYDFYKRPNVQYTMINSTSQIACKAGYRCLVILDCHTGKVYGQKFQSSTLIFSQCPFWIYKINFIHDFAFRFSCVRGLNQLYEVQNHA